MTKFERLPTPQPEPLHTYFGECCVEWILAFGFRVGRCGLCGEIPTYKREDPDCRHCALEQDKSRSAS